MSEPTDALPKGLPPLPTAPAGQLGKKLRRRLEAGAATGKVAPSRYVLDASRIADDLAGLQQHPLDRWGPPYPACTGCGRPAPCDDALRYSADLYRLAWAYEVRP